MIDQNSAYNTINRESIYRILKDKNILTIDEVDFLQAIHDTVYIRWKGKLYYLKNGFH